MKKTSPTNTITNEFHWWNNYTLGQNHSLFFVLGELELSILPLDKEAQISYQYLLKEEERYQAPQLLASQHPELKHTERFVINKWDNEIRLAPILADRPVVVRPKNNLYLLPNQSTTLYVSTALWLSIYLGNVKEPVKELRSISLSDTWMGATTREGEICYAARTSGKISREQVIHSPFRAVTPVKLKNSGKDIFAVERIALPTPHLSLYEDEDSNLWTNAVAIDRIELKDIASIKLESKPPEHAKNAKLVSKPREQVADNKLSKTLKHLLS
jgi:hypothetical protein